MKRIAFTIFIFLNLICLNIICQNKETTATTLKETVEWMAGKINNVEYYSPQTKYYYHQKLEWDNEKKLIRITHWLTLSPISSRLNIVVYEFAPQNINKDNFKINKNESGTRITYTCNNESRLIKTYVIKNDKVDKENEGMFYSDWIDLYPDAINSNPNLSDRFIKAFQHLIKLTGGKGEPF
jgi:hypothetical protein